MDELVKKLRCCGNAIYCFHCPCWEGCGGEKENLRQAADAIEKLNSQVESLCETIDLYRKLLGGHPDPRGEDGEPGVKCIDCQSDCQMIGLDMPACTAYKATKEE